MVTAKIGDKYGRWTVIGEKIRKNHNTYIPCRCECGNAKEVSWQNLRNGISTSCGCYHKELLRKQKYVHGEKHTRLYSTWIKMRHRCNSPNDSHYKAYGGRGIKVCDEWEHSYQAFSEWAKANGYDENKTWRDCSIDRIDNDKGYSPDNCRWVDIKTQASNKQNNLHITYKGLTKTVTEWSRETGIQRQTLTHRYLKGLPIEEVFFVGNLKDKKGATMISEWRVEQHSAASDDIELRGLSTDTKPTEWNGRPVGNGSSFFELDTQTVFFFDADSQTWV